MAKHRLAGSPCSRLKNTPGLGELRQTGAFEAILRDVKGRSFIRWFSVFFVLLGVANLVEGLITGQSFWIVLGVGFVVLAVSNYVVRRRDW
jgi:hypothetical protein